MKTVSIVVITHNNAGHIEDMIESVKGQTHPAWNCTIVDNGSADTTHYLSKKLTSGNDRFELFLKENEGPSCGRNFGFDNLAQKGTYLHFLDGDDKLHPEFLSRMVAYMESNPNVGLLGCQFDVINSVGQYVGSGYRSRIGPGRFGLPAPLKPEQNFTPFACFFAATGQGPFALFRTSCFEETAGYEPDFWSHEDSDIFCQMALISDVHYIPDRLYLKRVHASNITGSSRASYSKFRSKWDSYTSNDPEIKSLIENGLRYYYTRHKPLRDFKVSVKSLRRALLKLDPKALKWSLTCFYNGMQELFFQKTYKGVRSFRSQFEN